MARSTSKPVRGPVTVSVRDRKSGVSLSITAYPQGATLSAVAAMVEWALHCKYRTTSITDRRHKRR